MRPPHPCAVPNCSSLVRGRARCPEHTVTREERNPKDPRQAQFYGSVQWKTLRRIVKARDPICKICDRNPTQEADHIDDDWGNNALENLQGVCTLCHNSKSGKQHYWKRVPTLHPFLILVGQAGVGKSTIRKHLVPMLNANDLGPDDYDGNWKEVYEQLDHSPRAIVECCVVPGALSRKAKDRGAFIVELTLPDTLRRARLSTRKYSPEGIRILMAQTRRLGYEQVVHADLILDTSGDPYSIAQTINKRVNEAWGASK